MSIQKFIACEIYPIYGIQQDTIFEVDLHMNVMALWLSWLKRLSSKQEITGSNPVKAFFLNLFFQIIRVCQF